MQIGDTYEYKNVVTKEITAGALGSGGLDIFATPFLICWMEAAAYYYMKEQLPEGKSSVGTMVNVRHVSPSPIGAEITAKAELIAMAAKANEEHVHEDEEEEHEHHHHHDHENGVCSCGHHHHHHHGHDADEVFVSWGTETVRKFGEDELSAMLSQLDGGEYGLVLRAKGIVPCTDGGWIHFDYTPGEQNIRKGPADYTGRLCVIGAHIDEKALRELFKA